MVTAIDKNKALSDLFLCALEGDQAAYTTFLNEITPLIRRFIGRKIISADIEDVVQEVLISIHKARHTYDGQRPLMPWLFSIANFRVTDYLRKHYSQMRHQAVDFAEFENIIADVTEQHTDNEYIDEMLADVPEKHKHILTMMHVEGYTAKEIGKRIGMKESAVKVAAHRAIKKIRGKFRT